MQQQTAKQKSRQKGGKRDFQVNGKIVRIHKIVREKWKRPGKGLAARPKELRHEGLQEASRKIKEPGGSIT